MKKILFLLTYFLFQSSTLAQIYPSLNSVIISATVSIEKSNSMFFFDYTLKNSVNNVGSIISYDIDISASPNSNKLDTIGLRFENDGFTEGHFRRRFPTLKDKIVPVSFLSSPGRWGGLFSNNLTAGWNGYPLIRPGETLGDFIIMSKGIPGIRRCIVSPRFDVDELFPDIEDTTRTLTIAQMDSIREAVNFRGWTIGPTAPPLNFVPVIWIDTLISYKHQAVTLGWLKDKKEEQKDEDDEEKEDGVVAKLDKRLEKARAELLKGDSIKARKELEKFVKKVEKLYKESDEEEGKNKPEKVVITSEGFALLKYNAEYLIDRLPKKQKGGKE
jgi:hypothetical protein